MQNYLQYWQQAKDSLCSDTLYVVATPIGNLADITLRALATLDRADLVCAEDTRVTRHLLAAYGIKAKLVSVREHNESAMAKQIIEALQAGQIVAQVSDAGTPAICDPGARLVTAVREAGFKVCPIVGSSAISAALSVAGVCSPEFYFAAFLPAKSAERKKIISAWQETPYAVVCYETPHRIVDTLADMEEILGGDRKIVVARELTKTYETILSGRVSEVRTQVMADNNQTRGEFVLVIEGVNKERQQVGLSEQAQKTATILSQYLSTKQSAQAASELTGEKKNLLYDYLLSLKDND